MNIRLLALCLGLGTTFTCLAESESISKEWNSEKLNGWVVAGHLGLDLIDVGDTHHASVVEGFLPDEYSSTNTPFQVGYGIFVGRQWQPRCCEGFDAQLGLSYDFLPRFDVKGDIDEFGDPSLNDLSYKYRIQHQRLSVELKTLYEMKDQWYPYVLLGVGVAWNKSYHYTEHTSSITEVPRNPFKDTTTTAFAWSVGVGIEKEIYEHIRLGLAYLYTDAGQAELNAIKSGDSLTIENLSINQILFEASYIF